MKLEMYKKLLSTCKTLSDRESLCNSAVEDNEISSLDYQEILLKAKLQKRTIRDDVEDLMS